MRQPPDVGGGVLDADSQHEPPSSLQPVVSPPPRRPGRVADRRLAVQRRAGGAGVRADRLGELGGGGDGGAGRGAGGARGPRRRGGGALPAAAWWLIASSAGG